MARGGPPLSDSGNDETLRPGPGALTRYEVPADSLASEAFISTETRPAGRPRSGLKQVASMVD